jgi:hypothetical protein
MAGSLLFFVGILLSGTLVCRAVLGSWWRAYPLAFCYFSVTAAQGVGGWLIYSLRPGWYGTFRWTMEGLYIALGFGLIWQVYAAIPHEYPGVGNIIKTLAQRMAAVSPVFLVAAVAAARRGTVTLDVLERDFRVVQAMLIVTVFGLVTYYAIPLSRNLLALIRGYGLYITIFIVRYTLWPMRYTGFWQYVMPLAYMAAQVIWLWGLWRYENSASEMTTVELDVGMETYSEMVRLRRQLQRPFIQ